MHTQYACEWKLTKLLRGRKDNLRPRGFSIVGASAPVASRFRRLCFWVCWWWKNCANRSIFDEVM